MDVPDELSTRQVCSETPPKESSLPTSSYDNPQDSPHTTALAVSLRF